MVATRRFRKNVDVFVFLTFHVLDQREASLIEGSNKLCLGKSIDPARRKTSGRGAYPCRDSVSWRDAIIRSDNLVDVCCEPADHAWQIGHVFQYAAENRNLNAGLVR